MADLSTTSDDPHPASRPAPGHRDHRRCGADGRSRRESRSLPATPSACGPRKALLVLVVVQLAAGALNVWLLAPVWMQMLHLLLADGVWIALVMVSAAALSERTAA